MPDLLPTADVKRQSCVECCTATRYYIMSDRYLCCYVQSTAVQDTECRRSWIGDHEFCTVFVATVIRESYTAYTLVYQTLWLRTSRPSLFQGRPLAASTRVLSSTPDKPSYTERQAQTGRPLSPHVTIYDFPPAALSSIANRVTGIALVGGGCNEERVHVLGATEIG